jgi:hypothetical protein
MQRLASLSVDLDETHHYARVHGLPETSAAAGAVYRTALPRFEEFARALGVPLTFFAIGADAQQTDNARALKSLAQAGHEVANHSLDHCYDLTRLSPEAMRQQVERGAEAIERATGIAPLGFRAPGYLLNDTLVRVLQDCGVRYDSSVFPCPAYYAAKALVLARQRLGGRVSSSLIDSPSVLQAPSAPYRLGKPYFRRGTGLLELPIQVTPRLRLPFIGTTLTLGGLQLARWLTRQVASLPFVNLELHGIDLLQARDNLEPLARYQSDLRVPLSKKQLVLSEVVQLLQRSGFEFVRLDQAASVLGSRL